MIDDRAGPRVAVVEALDHVLAHRLRPQERGREMDLEHLLPLLERHLLDHRRTCDAGIVRQAVDRAEAGDGLGHGREHEGLVGHVARLDEHRLAMALLELAQPVGVEVDRHHPRTQ